MHTKPRDLMVGNDERLSCTVYGGFLGSARYEVLDDPDLLVEIAEWESTEARQAHMQEARATGACAPSLEVLAAPFRVMVVRQLS